MKVILLMLAATLMLQRGEPAEYPKDWYCTPRGTMADGVQTPNDPCHCEHEDTSHDCEGHPTENNKCKQWCHATDNKGPGHNHCQCPVVCHTVESQPDPENQS